LIFLADRLAKNQKGLESLTLAEAMLIGLAQSLAILPGASRSGMTIMAALFIGFRRQESARFSFLLSTPVIVGAALLELPKISWSQINGPFIVGFSLALVGFVYKVLLSFLSLNLFLLLSTG